MKVVTVEDIARLDRMAYERFGISPLLLMENAGNAVAYVIDREFDIKGSRFLIVAGPGNNGGDSFVVARKLYSNGGEVKLYILGDPRKYKREARENYGIIKQIPIERRVLKEIDDEFMYDIEWADAIVDGIFGTGIRRKVSGVFRDVIEAINHSGRIVFSIDIPSGVNGDTGEVLGTAIVADFTITLGLPKIGLFLFPGADYVGKLYVSHISYPPELYNDDNLKLELNTPLELPSRRRDTHKGDYGKALFIAGSAQYLGAPYFASMSFLKAGGGLSYLATPKSISTHIAGKGNEVVVIPLSETPDGSISRENISYLLELSDKVDIVILGPGISLNKETQEVVKELTIKIDKPLIIDGDGITAISNAIDLLKKRRVATILTPHLGEMSRLTGIGVEDIKRDKIRVLREYTKKTRSIIVLKGSYTMIGYPDNRVFINTSGNPGMATAGSGDVLTGSIAAMYGLGLNLEEAVRMGVFLHGVAGDLAAVDMGMDGITAGDIMDYLPDAVSFIRENILEIQDTIYYTISRV